MDLNLYMEVLMQLKPTLFNLYSVGGVHKGSNAKCMDSIEPHAVYKGFLSVYRGSDAKFIDSTTSCSL